MIVYAVVLNTSDYECSGETVIELFLNENAADAYCTVVNGLAKTLLELQESTDTLCADGVSENVLQEAQKQESDHYTNYPFLRCLLGGVQEWSVVVEEMEVIE